MSDHLYAIDKENKVLVDLGNVSKQMFEEDFEYYCKVREKLENKNLNLDEKLTINNVPMADLKVLLDCYDIVQNLLCISSKWRGLDYCWSVLEFDVNKYHDNSLIHECEIDNSKFKHFTYLS